MISKLRIVGGSLRGRTILAPQGMDTRPTADRTRESLFHLLQSQYFPAGFENVRVLDLFAGSGALGFEAISRGAAHLHAFEGGRDAGQVLRQNIQSLGIAEKVKLTLANLPQAISQLEGSPGLIFCDPPYDLDATSLLQPLSSHARTRAILCYEHERTRRPVLKKPWRLRERRTWGVATVSIFELEPEPTPA